MVLPLAPVGAMGPVMLGPPVQVPTIWALGTGFPLPSVNSRVTAPPEVDDGNACSSKPVLTTIGTSTGSPPALKVTIASSSDEMPAVVRTPVVQPSSPVALSITPEPVMPSMLPVPIPSPEKLKPI